MVVHYTFSPPFILYTTSFHCSLSMHITFKGPRIARLKVFINIDASTILSGSVTDENFSQSACIYIKTKLSIAVLPRHFPWTITFRTLLNCIPKKTFYQMHRKLNSTLSYCVLRSVWIAESLTGWQCWRAFVIRELHFFKHYLYISFIDEGKRIQLYFFPDFLKLFARSLCIIFIE